MEDWYNVTLNDFDDAGVKAGISGELGSFTRSLMRTFPEHDWHGRRFRSFSFLSASPHQVKSYVTSLGAFLGVKQMDEWYSVTYDQIRHFSMQNDTRLILLF